jgi:serine acetyltransferase
MNSGARAFRELWEVIQQDRQANPGNAKARIVLGLFRVSHALRGSGPRPRPVSVPLGILYRVVVDWIMGIELPWRTNVGPGLRLDHGHALVVHDHTIIGRNVTLRHSVTLGMRRGANDCPTIGDGVDVGAGAIILGDISIGDGARIAAGAVVLDDVPPGASAVGNPARIVDATSG